MTEGHGSVDVLSDQLLVGALLAYLTAMVSFAVHNALMPRQSAPTAPRELAAVASGAHGSGAGLATAPAAADAATRTALWAERAAIAATTVAAVLHAGCLAARGLAASRVPWGNMYEFVMAACLVGVVA